MCWFLSRCPGSFFKQDSFVQRWSSEEIHPSVSSSMLQCCVDQSTDRFISGSCKKRDGQTNTYRGGQGNNLFICIRDWRDGQYKPPNLRHSKRCLLNGYEPAEILFGIYGGQLRSKHEMKRKIKELGTSSNHNAYAKDCEFTFKWINALLKYFEIIPSCLMCLNVAELSRRWICKGGVHGQKEKGKFTVVFIHILWLVHIVALQRTGKIGPKCIIHVYCNCFRTFL